MTIRPYQRHSRRRPCAVCGGGYDMTKGRGIRCNGTTSENGAWCRCSREERAGGLAPVETRAGTVFVHRLNGPCRCGAPHGGIVVVGPVAFKDDHPAARGCLFRSPIPDGAPPLPWTLPGARVPVAVYTWTDSTGRPCFLTTRWEWEQDGERVKAVTPRTVWERPDGSLTWEKVGPPPDWPRPLLNLAAIASNPAAPILVVEGEKAALAAARRAPGYMVTTWHGGASSVHLADWRPVAGRAVTIWPDADADGTKAAAAVAAECHKVGAASVRVVKLPPGLPRGWDLADPWPEGLEVPSWTA